MITKKQGARCPSTNGVYLFKSGTKVLYIGKSVNIRARVLSHIENAKLDKKESLIVNGSDRTEYFITDSEFKALLLESALIKKYHPKYNVIWKDNKSYLYIKITIKDKYPKVLLVRRENDGRSLYFGPFSGVRTAESILREIRRIIPFCSQKKISKNPCFYSKINLCAPCPNEIENLSDGKRQTALRRIYKNNIHKVVKLLAGHVQKIINSLNKKLKYFSKREEYEAALDLRKRILRLEQLLYKTPFTDDISIHHNRSREALNSLLRLLNKYFPQLDSLHRIECYDISNLTQKNAAASMVILTDGLIDRDKYRRFKIKNLNLKSDLAMLEEILNRRFKNNWSRPDLIVVDGGRPQVATIRQVLKELKKNIPLIGIAKHPDRLIIGTVDLPTIKPEIHNLGYNLIRLARDESHRFARKYHLFLRDRDFLI